jgi:ATP-dependent DNA helicase HFM1/MER3
MIQAQLGGVDLPADKEFVQIRRQYLVDKTLIFDRIQRLIRCVIDCKVNDCDAISTRHALDFCRSLSAGYWEHSNLQLRQIPQVGPAASRKLATGNINSVEKLTNLDTATIERIMGRNPPFGRKTLDSVAGFPHLTLSLEIVKKVLSKAGNNPKVQIKSRLGYKNSMLPIWAGQKPSVTFMAETSDGTLIHFWRGSIQQLAKGQELKFDAELSGPGEDVKCCIACDDIVGTVVSYILKHDLPASAFSPPKIVKPAELLTQPTETGLIPTNTDEFGGDDFEDAEFLEAVQVAEMAPASDYDSDDVVNMDDVPDRFADKTSANNFTQSVQMTNGKWTCNHSCRSGRTLKNGLTCNTNAAMRVSISHGSSKER